ncbi:unnamed protein product, partial [marine sediment metagenome]
MALSRRNPCELAQLRDFPMPDPTPTYVPLGHYDLAINVRKVADDFLLPKGYTFLKEEYGTAKDGNRMFGLLTFKNGGEDLGFLVGFRNSYDKSMAAGIACGAQVFVCDNLCFSGEITVLKKHTKNIKEELFDELIVAMHRSADNFHEIQESLGRYKSIGLTDDDGYRMIGLLLGRAILTPTMANAALRAWRAPEYKEFEERNVYSLYSAVTESLKLATPDRMMECHINAHKV